MKHKYILGGFVFSPPVVTQKISGESLLYFMVEQLLAVKNIISFANIQLPHYFCRATEPLATGQHGRHSWWLIFLPSSSSSSHHQQLLPTTYR
jgi:hypothetical protein